jgi:hypothetical protein
MPSFRSDDSLFFGGDDNQPRRHRPPSGPFNPFVSIWTDPRTTIRRIVKRDPTEGVTLLVALFGISNSLDRGSLGDAADDLPLFVILLVAIVLGSLSGLASLWLPSHLMKFVGSWLLEGRASRAELKAAMAWGMVPRISVMILLIPMIMVFGKDFFSDKFFEVEPTSGQELLLIIHELLTVACICWSIIIASMAIAEVQGFRSAWYGFLNIVLAFVVVVGVIIAVVGPIIVLSSS